MDQQALAALGRFFQICIELAQQQPDDALPHKAPDSRRVGATDARKMVGVGKTKFTQLYRSGEIPSHKDGSRRMFYVRDLENFNRRKAKEK